MVWMALLACVPSPGLGDPVNESPGAAVLGDPAVDLPLIDANGDTFHLADARGKVIFLDMSGFH